MDGNASRSAVENEVQLGGGATLHLTPGSGGRSLARSFSAASGLAEEAHLAAQPPRPQEQHRTPHTPEMKAEAEEDLSRQRVSVATGAEEKHEQDEEG